MFLDVVDMAAIVHRQIAVLCDRGMGFSYEPLLSTEEAR